LTPRIIVTGGSGFIGTNVVDYFVNDGAEVINIDDHPPRKSTHVEYWREVSILDVVKLKRTFEEFSPSHLIHLAARTDRHGATLDDYAANTVGVANVIEAAESQPSLRQAIFASSMLVCRPGYIPRHPYDYAPSTVYGQSKVVGEQLVQATRFPHASWVLVRPTSIWGPWFDEPYLYFFRAVLKRRFVKFAGMGTKTIGYVGNTVSQLAAILKTPTEAIHRRMFYLGDKPPMRIDTWADAIVQIAKVQPLRRVPFAAVYGAAKFGDALQLIGVRPPLTSFRLRNMTNDNAVVDVDQIYALADTPRWSLEEGIRHTLEWMYEHD